MMRVNRRNFLAGVLGTGAIGINSTYANKDQAKKAASSAPSLQELDKAAAAPVLKLDKLKTPVIIESIKLLKKDEEYFVHVRSKDGAALRFVRT